MADTQNSSYWIKIVSENHTLQLVGLYLSSPCQNEHFYHVNTPGMEERQAYSKYFTKDLNALLVSEEQKASRGFLCRQNIPKAFPREWPGDTTESSTSGHSTCTWGLQGALCLGIRDDEQGATPAWNVRRDMPKDNLGFSTQPSHPQRGPSWAINL